MTNRQKKLAGLRVLQIITVILMVIEFSVAIRLCFYNANIVCNESMRFIQNAEDIYNENYYKFSQEKSNLKASNPIAALPIFGRVSLYTATILIFTITTKKRNRIVKTIKRQREEVMAARVAVAESESIYPHEVIPKTERRETRVDIAKYYNYNYNLAR